MRVIKERSVRKLITVLIAAVLVITASIGMTMAYFTDHNSASGYAPLKLTTDSKIYEGKDNTEKNVYVKNTGEADMLVRVKFFGPEQMVVTPPADGWTYNEEDGWYYYNEALGEGEDTSAHKINAKIEVKAEGDTPEDVARKMAELGDKLQIAVVHESTILAYDEDGSLIVPAGWNVPAGIPN